MILSTNLSGILFANLAKPPGEDSGTASDWLQSQRTTQSLSLINEAIFSSRGVVTKSLKEGVIGTFPDAATTLQAAIKIHALLTDAESKTGTNLTWRLGLHFAKLHVFAGSVAGEGLEGAIELADKADATQILISASLADSLAQNPLPDGVRLVKTQHQLGGQSVAHQLLIDDQPDALEAETKPLPVMSRLPDPPAAVTTSQPASAAGTSLTTLIVLEIAGNQYPLNNQTPHITVGRGKENDVRIRGTHVSRLHGYFEYRDGAGYFVDQSANGSCLLVSDKETHLHKTPLLLDGEGLIGLGPTREKSPDELIKFTVTQTSKPARDPK